jgi:hypothetical protein
MPGRTFERPIRCGDQHGIDQRKQPVAQHRGHSDLKLDAFCERSQLARYRAAFRPAAHYFGVDRYPAQCIPQLVTRAAHHFSNEL